MYFHKKMYFLLVAGCIAISVNSQDRRNTLAPIQPPSISSTSSSPFRPGPKPYKEVITEKALSKRGLFHVHKVEEKWFFELGDSLMGRDILVVNRFSKATCQSFTPWIK